MSCEVLSVNDGGREGERESGGERDTGEETMLDWGCNRKGKADQKGVEIEHLREAFIAGVLGWTTIAAAAATSDTSGTAAAGGHGRVDLPLVLGDDALEFLTLRMESECREGHLQSLIGIDRPLAKMEKILATNRGSDLTHPHQTHQKPFEFLLAGFRSAVYIVILASHYEQSFWEPTYIHNSESSKSNKK